MPYKDPNDPRKRISNENAWRKHQAKRSGNAALIWASMEQQLAHRKKNTCEVCGKMSGRLFADHCWKCGDYRGALCIVCNTDEGSLTRWGVMAPDMTTMGIYQRGHKCPTS